MSMEQKVNLTRTGLLEPLCNNTTQKQILLCMKFPKDSVEKLLRGTQVNHRKSLEKKLIAI